MSSPFSFSRTIDALARVTARSPSNGQTTESIPHGITVAISREVGAGGSSIARALGERMGWKVYDQELLEHIAQSLHTKVKWLAELDEHHVSWLQELIEGIGQFPRVRENTYIRQLVDTLFKIAAEGHAIVVGRGGAQVLPPPTTLRVRLVAPLEDRVRMIAAQRNFSLGQAERYIHEHDLHRVTFVLEHFQRDPSDPLGYDIILNTSRFSIAECVELIAESARVMQARLEQRCAVAIP